MSVSLELLTDEAIIDYTKSDGKDQVLFNHRDLDLKYNGIQPIAGGVYDVDIFGSPMEDRCICGKSDNPLLNLVLIAGQEYLQEKRD